MGSGDGRRRQRGQQDDNGNSPGQIAFGMLAFGVATGGIWAQEIGTALDQVYCTPQSCLTLPQVLIGWAVAVTPLLVSLWSRAAAIYLGVFLLGMTATLLIATGGTWVLPQACLLVGLLFVPISLGVARLAGPGRRAVVVAGQHWLLLAGLILWLA
ncbi:hypothetical protein [Lentzea flava]|uniref:Vitamin K epoxide reductase family protein n=1 Tax=Lentzea flava TaxID=103732 RepID=A0ABQ2V6K2_9PSEU|nr:hypothetical protein [Lentzea flava]MCP2203617.1 hypothetical protein [Lentzea flava]GGU69729.1 hypothetical protein GCM10010178_71910 [Lentzea flava]